MTDYALTLIDVCKHYNQVVALADINLTVRRGEFLTVLGPSGSGKSTLLKIVGGFEDPTKGEIYINEQLINGLPPYRRPTSMVFQDLALFPHLNVYDNIAYGLKIRKISKEEIRERILRIAELLHIEGLLNRRISQLSGGQQQRVALARSLVIEPEILLLDEPLGPLDLKLRREMQLELRKIQRELNSTWIYVTHDHEEAMVMSDTVVIVKDGRIQEIGPIREIYERPKTKFVAEFLGETNLTECRVESIHNGLLTASHHEIQMEINNPCSESPAVGDRVLVMIRPEKIKISRQPPNIQHNVAKGKVTEVIYKGPLTDLKIETASKWFVVRTFDDTYNVGETVYIYWNSTDPVVIQDCSR
ncbi:MAG: ABC transporter ATP-binding protein [Candidatus Caldarchaeum sp.]